MEQMLTIMSILFTLPVLSQVHGVFAVLLLETFRKITWGAEAYLVGYLLNGFRCSTK